MVKLEVLACLCLYFVGSEAWFWNSHITPGKKIGQCGKKLECPPFELLYSNDQYEVRRYAASTWVSHMGTAGGSRPNFMKLFSYIQGANDKEQKIDMTAPVLMRLDTLGNALDMTETMSFYLPMEEAPTPTDPSVTLTSMPAFTVFVRAFGGFASQGTYMDQLEDLKQDLQESPNNVWSEVSQDHAFKAGYDAPYKWFNRRNEVMYQAKNEDISTFN